MTTELERKRILDKARKLIAEKDRDMKKESLPLKGPRLCWQIELPSDLAKPPINIPPHLYSPLTVGIRCVVLRHVPFNKEGSQHYFVESFSGTVSSCRYDIKAGYGVCTITLDDGRLVYDIPQDYITSQHRKSKKWKKKLPGEVTITCIDCGKKQAVDPHKTHLIKRCDDCRKGRKRLKAAESRKRKKDAQ